MRIGMSTASLFSRYDLEDKMPVLAANGVKVCEVFLNTWSEYQEEYIELLAKKIANNNIEVFSIHPMGSQFEPQLFSKHPRQRADAWRVFEDVLKAGGRMNACCYVMHGPANLGGVVKNMQLTRIGPIVQDLCDMAAEYGMKIAWENVSWAQYCYPQYGQELLYATKKDDLRFTLDIKQAARSGFSPLEYLQSMGSRMINLHVCDYALKDGKVSPLLPGQGECDFAVLFHALKDINYQGPALLEVYSDMYQTEKELFASYAFLGNFL